MADGAPKSSLVWMIAGGFASVAIVAGLWYAFARPTAPATPVTSTTATATVVPAASSDELAYLTPPVASSAPPLVVDPVTAAVNACFDRDDLKCARDVLEKAVGAAGATPYQVQMLYDLCTIQADAACEARVAKAHPTVDRASSRQMLLKVPAQMAAAFAPVSSVSVADQARKTMLTDPAAARAMLESRVFARTATADEAGLLWNICKAQRDAACRAKVDELYPTHPR